MIFLVFFLVFYYKYLNILQSRYIHVKQNDWSYSIYFKKFEKEKSISGLRKIIIFSLEFFFLLYQNIFFFF